MGLEEIKCVGNEAVEVLGIHQTPEGYYVYLCIGKVVVTPNIVLGEEEGNAICHIITKNNIIELPIVKNPGYVTFNKYT